MKTSRGKRVPAGKQGAGNARNAQLHGQRLIVVPVVWLSLVLLTIGLFAVSVPVLYTQLRTPCVSGLCLDERQLNVDNVRALQVAGLSVTFYAAYHTVLNVTIALAWFAIAGLLSWRKPSEPSALFVALMFVLAGAGIVSITDVLVVFGNLWGNLAHLLNNLGFVSLFTLFYVLPDGKFVPRWTGMLALLATILMVSATLFPDSDVDLSRWGLMLWFFMVLLFSSIFAQVYRYRYVSDAAQRQQTKWLVFGVTAAFGTTIGIILLSSAFPSLEQPDFLVSLLLGALATYLPMLLIPLSIGIAITRYRLWDIDVIINRTLVYGLLTAMLAGLYVVMVVVLQAIVRGFTGNTQSDIITIVSTLIIAALFGPLRRRIQALIDRRFYRHKYDAAKTLQAFSARLRDEVELHALTDDLLAVVDETLRPAHVSLWLREPKREVQPT